MADGGGRNRSGLRKPMRIESGIGAIFVAWAAVLATRAISDNSFFTHLATGRLILESGVPRSDPYSYTAPGAEWVVQSWAASGLYALVEDLAGFGGLRFLTGLLAGAVTAVAWRLTRGGSTVASRVIAMALFLAVVSTFLIPRPMLVGLLAFALVVLSEESRWERAWPLTVIGLVWVNVHGSWPMGLVYVVVSLAGRWSDDRGRDGTPRGGVGRSVGIAGLDRAGLVRLGHLAGGVVVGGLVGLAGPRLLVFPLALLGRSEQLQVIIEWQSPSFSHNWARAFLVLVALAVLGLVRRPSHRWWLLWSVFVAAALLGLRNVPVAAVVLVPMVAAGVGDLGSMDSRSRSPVAAVLLSVAVVLASVGIVTQLGGDDLDLATYPMGALEVVERAGLVTDPDVRLLTSEKTGNLIELRHGTDAAVFLDDRVDMYPSAVIADFMVLVRGGSSWEEVLDRHEVDAVLWGADTPLATILDGADGWDVVYEDDDAIVACRAGLEACDRI